VTWKYGSPSSRELNAVFLPDDAENVEVIGDLAAGVRVAVADAARAGEPAHARCRGC